MRQVDDRDPAIAVEGVRHLYGDREALAGVSFTVLRGEIFGLLGPNGSGKTTLFRILSTLVRPSGGGARVFGRDLLREADAVRARLGVVFQRPSVDGKLTVRENLHAHGRLYGMGGSELEGCIEAMLERLGLAERSGDYVETLSGGLQRRVELAKGLLPQPALLLLDEPSTGLDPGARRDFNQYLGRLRNEEGVTVVLTTHYLEEAEQCDRVAIMHEGRVVNIGTPAELKSMVGGDVVVIHAADLVGMQGKIGERFGCEGAVVEGTLRIERPRAHEFVRELMEAFPADVASVTIGKPTLEDVFIHLTGHRFWASGQDGAEG